MELPIWKIILISVSFLFQIILIVFTIILKINTPIHNLIVIYVVFTLLGSIFHILSIGLNVCLLEWIGRFGFHFLSRLMQMIISIEILISLFRPGMDKDKRKKTRIVIITITFFYAFLNCLIPPISNIIQFSNYETIISTSGEIINNSICYRFNPPGLILIFEVVPFVLFTLFALASLLLSIWRAKRISKANNKNRKSRILFYSTMVLIVGLVRLGSLPEEIYFLLDANIPFSITLISYSFLYLEPILVFIACCINNSIPSRLWHKIFRKKQEKLPKNNNQNVSNPSIEMDAYSLGSFQFKPMENAK